MLTLLEVKWNNNLIIVNKIMSWLGFPLHVNLVLGGFNFIAFVPLWVRKVFF